MLETRILSALETEFDPAALEVENTSVEHASHREVQDMGVETHFSIGIKSKVFNRMVSRTFVNLKSLLDRHRLVYDSLGFAFDGGLHAIQIDCDSDESRIKCLF